MSLQKRWRDLDRSTIARAPDRYGVYELGTESGDSLGVSVGVLRDELKDALAYGTAAKVRWIEATSKAHAEQLATEH
ncbi:MAG: DUF7508 domain-containing protein [Halobacteriota archaeon]